MIWAAGAARTGVGVGDLVGLVGVQPDLLLAAAQHAGGKPLLEPEHAAKHKSSESGARNRCRQRTHMHTTGRILGFFRFGN